VRANHIMPQARMGPRDIVPPQNDVSEVPKLVGIIPLQNTSISSGFPGTNQLELRNE
jgi:hypothetical protein